MDWDTAGNNGQLRGRTASLQETSERKKRQQLRNKKKKGVLVIKREFIHK
jgi:hypothetical protein